MHHILAAQQFNTDQIEGIFHSADYFRDQSLDNKQRIELTLNYAGHQLCSLFYEPSTRTRISFEKAAANFGMGIVSTENASEFSSAAKGESLEDTIKVINEYGFDIIVLRHPETGAAARAAAVSDTPLINAGDGTGEHPTQALLDAYTIYRNFGRLDHLKVTMGGDLANGRTVRSLAQLLSHYPGNDITFVSTPELQIGEDIKLKLRESGTGYQETTDIYESLRQSNVVYWTRMQKERSAQAAATLKDAFIIDSVALEVLPKNAIIMHPLPRIKEIASTVDQDPRAKYFQQAGNGLFIRMALIDRILKSN